MSSKSVFYLLFTATLLVFFYRSLSNEIANSVFEQDLIWYIPNFVWQIQDLSGIALIKHLLAPSLWYMDPVTKSYFWICHTLFGVQIRYYIYVTLLVHLCNALLVYVLCRRVKLSFLTSYLSALSTFVFFAQFHAYLWPMAFQHIIVVFFILLGFNLYLKTDELATEGYRFAKYWVWSLIVNILASLCRFNIVILPAMMLTHILFCSSDDSQRIRKLKLWLPIVAIYLGNPLYSLFGAGDNRAHIDLTVYSYWQALLFGLLALVASFYLYNGYVRLKGYLPKNFGKYFILASSVLGACVVFLVRGFSNSIPAIIYSLLIPFIACFKAFLEPLQTAQSGLSTFAYYLIPTQASITSYLLVAACLSYFVSVSLRKYRTLLVLFVWYLMCFVFLVHQDPIRGRYFIFLAPIFSIVFCVVIVRLIDFLFSYAQKVHLPRFKEAATVLLFACLFATNIAAIKLASFRGRLVNALNSFDYIKAAMLIKNDIQTDTGLHIKPEQIVIRNILPAPFPEPDYRDITQETTDHYFNGKAVFAQIFMDNDYFNVSFQETPTTEKSPRVYTFKNNRIERNNHPVDSFDKDFDLGKQQLANLQLGPAQASFEKAIQHKTFLFRYLLGEMTFDDLSWITNRISFIDWIEELKRTNHLQDRWFNSDTQAVLTDIQGEVDAASECLFYLAYLGSFFGDREKELYWMGQLKILEDNSERLQRSLLENPLIASNGSLKQYAKTASEFLKYKDWKNWTLYYSFYLFEKFVMRLLGA